MKDVNDDNTLVLSSSGEVLQVNERGKCFYNTMRDIVERTYRCTFHLQYKNQYNDSKNQAIYKLQQAFMEQWSRRAMRLAIVKKYNSKTNHLKSIISKHVFPIICSQNS